MKLSMRRIGGLLLAALLLDLALILPNHPAAARPDALLLFPLELPAILLGLIALPFASRLSRPLRFLLVATLLVLVVFKIADFAMFTALGRPFNIVSDMVLLSAGWNVSTGAIGIGLAVVGVASLLAALAFLTSALWWSTGRWVRVEPTRGWRAAAAVAAVLATGVAVAEIGHTMRAWRLPIDPPGAAFTARVGVERLQLYRNTVADLARFQEASRTDAFAARDDLFSRLEGRDVKIVFVESYGRTSFENPLYVPTHSATIDSAEQALRLEGSDVKIVFVESYGRTSFENPLYVPTHSSTIDSAEQALRQAGLSIRSGWLESSTSGGQSWLAHSTLASGLRIDGQTRYAAMLGSPRQSLYDLARAAGYRTGAVMPAITMSWPEAPVLGFEHALAAADMEYQGRPFNWITMPDQYTLARYPDLLPQDTRPDFLQIALISSHAPWVPIPEMVPWDQVGDGTIFDQWATAGDPPSVVWRDRDRVRDQYRRAIDYSLRVTFDYVARESESETLFIVLGDHAPAGFVSQIDSFDVPIHIIGTPRALALFDHWGWTDGLAPAADLPSWPMEDFRDRFLSAVSDSYTQ